MSPRPHPDFDPDEQAPWEVGAGGMGMLAGGGPVVVRVSDVVAERVRWLWPGRIPMGKLTVLDGDPGLGKSTLSLDVAARVSTGSPLPTGERLEDPASVVVLSAEDGIADTIRPRLEAAGADLERVLVFTEVREAVGDRPPSVRPPSIPEDVDHLERLVLGEGVALVVIDPLMAYLQSKVDSYRDQDVRRVLHRLTTMAEATGAAVVILRHLSKTGGANPLYRGGGSIGIVGAARCGLLVAPDPEDDTRRILAVSKSNLAAIPEALAYRLATDEDRGTARVRWEGTTSHRAAELLRTRDADEDDGVAGGRQGAEAFLVDLLAGGPVAAKEALAEAKQADIAARTLDRARKRLGVISRKVGQPGEKGEWRWVLSSEERHGNANIASP